MATTVTIKNNDVDYGIKALKQKNARSGLLKEVREREAGYMNPGVKRRLAKEEAKKNSRRRQKRNNY